MHATPRCVVVDDDHDALELVERFVAMICPEFEIIKFLGGLEALEFVSKNRVELLITDFRMPGLDGLQLTSAVRALDQELPIIVLSGDEIENEALAHGANAFVQKNAIGTSLAGAIRQLNVHLRT
jgi:CheY-like chemotaxis protein